MRLDARNRPLLPPDATAGVATFIDPTVTIDRPEAVRLAERIYLAPFASLRTGANRIVIGAQSNLQDGVLVDASPGVVALGERVIAAHGASIIGPARIGEGEPSGAPEADAGVFLSFGARVEGAILERDTAVSALARVGPGVRLPSGVMILPGKDVTVQDEAERPELGKVRTLTDADRAFSAAVVRVNLAFARDYTALCRDDAEHVLGVNFAPGGAGALPRTGVAHGGGSATREPHFRNRIIGDVRLADELDRLDGVLGWRIALRADEGTPFVIGRIANMGDRVVLHALEGSRLRLGDGVRFGEGAIVHGGDLPAEHGHDEPRPTSVGDDVVLGAGCVVFRSRIGEGARIGAYSAVIGTELPSGAVVEDRTVIVDGGVFGPVEWPPDDEMAPHPPA